MGICHMTQGIQTGVQQQPRGVGKGGRCPPNAGDTGLTPGLGRSPESTPIVLPGKSPGWRSVVDYKSVGPPKSCGCGSVTKRQQQNDEELALFCFVLFCERCCIICAPILCASRWHQVYTGLKFTVHSVWNKKSPLFF